MLYQENLTSLCFVAVNEQGSRMHLESMKRNLTDFLLCQDSLEINGVGLGVGL